jgi:ATP-binding cassette subfamily C protein CydCD
MTGADVILLDEPTAHLDADAGKAMLADLRKGLTSRTVVLVTHNPDDIDPADLRLDLDARSAPAMDGAPDTDGESSTAAEPVLAREGTGR